MSGTGQHAFGNAAARLWYAAMQGTWLAAMLSMFNDWISGQPRPTMVLACLIYPASFAWARWCQRRGWRFTWETLGCGIISAAIFAACLWPLVKGYTWQGWEEPLAGLDEKRIWVLIIFGLFAWLRGWWLARAEINLARITSAVHWQIGVMMALVVPASIHDQEFQVSPWLLGLFFITAMVGYWLARTRESEQRRQQGSSVGGYLSLTIGFLLVFAIGFALWAAVDKDLLGVLKGPALWLWGGVEAAVEYLGHGLAWLLGLFVTNLKKPALSPMALEQVDQSLLQGQQTTMYSEKAGGVILASIFAIILTVILLVTVIAVIKALIAKRRSEQVPIAARQKGKINFSFFGSLWRALVSLVKWLIALPGLLATLLQGRSPGGVVQYYRNLQKWGARFKRPRRADQTPNEYLETLTALAPNRGQDLALITSAYVQARYGPFGEQGIDLDAVVSSWQRIKRTNPKTGAKQPWRMRLARALRAASR